MIREPMAGIPIHKKKDCNIPTTNSIPAKKLEKKILASNNLFTSPPTHSLPGKFFLLFVKECSRRG